MKKLWITAGSVLLLITACAGVRERKQLDLETGPTEKALDAADAVCRKHIDNEPLAVKLCFPMVTNHELLVRVDNVRTLISTVIVSGKVDTTHYRVECIAGADVQKKILQKPESIRVGSRYVMKGTTSEVRTSAYGYYGTTFHLTDCTMREFTAPPTAAK